MSPFPHLNEDCTALILSMLNKPDLSVLSRTSHYVLSYTRPWLIHNVNVCRFSQLIDTRICHFILKNRLGPYIRILRVTPNVKPMYFINTPLGQSWGEIDSSISLLADVVETATNLKAFRMGALVYTHGYLYRVPRLVAALRSRPHLQKLQLADLTQDDTAALISEPIAGLRCLQLTTRDPSESAIQDVFKVAGLSAQTLEEFTVIYDPDWIIKKPHQASGSLTSIFPHLRRLSIQDITDVTTEELSRAFPDLQHLRMSNWIDSDSPLLPSPGIRGDSSSDFASFPKLRSIAGHSTLATLSLTSNFTRLHLDQLLNSEEALENILEVMKNAPLISVSLLIRLRSPAEPLPRLKAARDDWPWYSSSVVPMVASCIPNVQYLEFGFSWGRFKAQELSPEFCAESILSSNSPCSSLAALKELRYLSFTVPGPRDRSYPVKEPEFPPNLQGIADDLLRTLPDVDYLALRSKGSSSGRMHYRNAKFGRSRSVTSSDDNHDTVQITGPEAHQAYLRYSYTAAGVEQWCFGGHEWQ